MTALKQVPIPVTARDGSDKAYLKLTVTDDRRVMVSPTGVGKVQLNRFWPVWLQQRVLDADRYKVSTDKSLVWVWSDDNDTDAEFVEMHERIRILVADIYPIAPPPIKRRDRSPANNMLCWDVRPDQTAVADERSDDLTEVFKLPARARLEQPTRGTLYLHRRSGCLLSLSELGMLVEWRVAQFNIT